MNLEYEILKEHSKRQAVRIGRWVGDNPARFKQLMELFLHGEYRVTQRSAWIISYCADQHPRLIAPWLAAMVKKMEEPGVHDAVKRNTLRILSNLKGDLSGSLLGRAVFLSFEYLNSPTAPIAVKVHAMTVLANAAKKKPALRNEIETSLHLLITNAGPALKARGRMVLKQLSAITPRKPSHISKSFTYS